jgi:hypothetical protein
VGLEGKRQADKQLKEPKRAGQIAENACGKMLARCRMEALGAHHARVLKITLAPAPVATCQVDQRGRALFI